jgi:hypothetical protein
VIGARVVARPKARRKIPSTKFVHRDAFLSIIPHGTSGQGGAGAAARRARRAFDGVDPLFTRTSPLLRHATALLWQALPGARAAARAYHSARMRNLGTASCSPRRSCTAASGSLRPVFIDREEAFFGCCVVQAPGIKHEGALGLLTRPRGRVRTTTTPSEAMRPESQKVKQVPATSHDRFHRKQKARSTKTSLLVTSQPHVRARNSSSAASPRRRDARFIHQGRVGARHRRPLCRKK